MIKFSGSTDWIVKDANRRSGKGTGKLTDKERRTLELLLEAPGVSSRQIAERLNVSRASVAKYLKTPKEMELIERVGSDRKGCWNLKLRQ